MRMPLRGSRGLSPRRFVLLAVTALAVVVILALAPAPAAAQGVTGALQGTVVSPEGAPEPDVHITVAGPHLQGSRSTMTDRDGFFHFLLLPPGAYEIRAGRIGARPILVRNLVVALGRTTAAPTLTLDPQPIRMDSVIVVAPPISLDPVHTTMGAALQVGDYEALPVQRTYTSILKVLPHANESNRDYLINVGGTSGLEAQYYVDGMNVTEVQNGWGGVEIPYNFIRSVNVRTGGYEARYGRALGAVVDAVTYSGTNQFEAAVFGVTQSDALTMEAKDAAVVNEEGAVYYEYGGRVSGPLVRDRLWYSAAVNPRVDRVKRTITGHGQFLDETKATRFAGKLTWRADSRTSLEGSVFGDPYTHDWAGPTRGGGITTITNPDPLLLRWVAGGTAASLRATVAPSRSLVLQASAGRKWERFEQTGATDRGREEPQYTDYVEGSIGGGFPWQFWEDRVRTSLATEGILTLPRHVLAAGVDYQDIMQDARFLGRRIDRYNSTYWVAYHQFRDGKTRNRSPAVYVQDTWRVTDRLALNLGLRWSAEYFIGASGNTAQQITDEWQPRAGFSWGVGSAGQHRIFGSYGRFYQSIPNAINALFQNYEYTYSEYSADPREPGAVPTNVIDMGWTESHWSRVPDLEGLSHDEFTLGYERVLGRSTTLTIRGIRRDLRSTFVLGVDPSRIPPIVVGNPGQGDFDFLPPPKREYTALELAAQGTWRRIGYRASYVLSRSWGNYAGYVNWENRTVNAQSSLTFQRPHQAANSTGFLPYDQPHVFKLSTDYATSFGVRSGAILSVASGNPVNDLYVGPGGAPGFVVQRGHAGRMPATWNLDLRFAYDLPVSRGPTTRLLLDVLHVGNPRSVVELDEWHYTGVDSNGSPILPSPNYLAPKAYQPPMAVRLGMEVEF